MDIEKGSSSLSSVKTSKTPYLYAVGLSEGVLKIYGPFKEEEEAEAKIIEENAFQGLDYKFVYSRFKNLSPTEKMKEALMRDSECK